MQKKYHTAAIALSSLAASAALAQPGSIIIIGDEWMVSNIAFSTNPIQAQLLTDNIANCFDNGGPASFAVMSSLTHYGNAFKTRLTTLGHTVTTTPAGPFTLTNLQNYDAVLLGGNTGSGPGTAAALTSYVMGGGHVMIMAGTGWYGPASGEATAWAPFLSTFGLGFGNQYFGLPPSGIPFIPATPLPNAATVGVSSVAWSYGQNALDLNPTDPLNQVAMWGNVTALGQPPTNGSAQSTPIIATWNVPAPGVSALAAGGLILVARRRRR